MDIKIPKIKITQTRPIWSTRREVSRVMIGRAKGKRLWGGCRNTFTNGKVVVKFDKGIRRGETISVGGCQGQCRREVAVWDALEEEDKRHFTPLLAHGSIVRGGYIYDYTITPYIKHHNRVKPVPDDDWASLEGVLDKYLVYDVSPTHNAGVLPTGEVVCWDYGY